MDKLSCDCGHCDFCTVERLQFEVEELKEAILEVRKGILFIYDELKGKGIL